MVFHFPDTMNVMQVKEYLPLNAFFKRWTEDIVKNAYNSYLFEVPIEEKKYYYRNLRKSVFKLMKMKKMNMDK